jgi:hypothetical protein
MSKKTRPAHSEATPLPSAASQLEQSAADAERRIRWERNPDNDRQLIVLDALTGHVIAVVRSLFEMRSP